MGEILTIIDSVVVENPDIFPTAIVVGDTDDPPIIDGDTDDPPTTMDIGPAPVSMVAVPAGNFKMGCDTTNIYDCSEANFAHEVPLHTVFLDSYFIDIHEVTNSQYAQCVAAGFCDLPESYVYDGETIFKDAGYNNSQFGNYPVVWIPWTEANSYCSWDGKNLPTEAQWEKAARGSSDTRIWPWGNTPPDCSLANYRHGGGGQGYCTEPDIRGNIYSSAVGSYPQGASPYGVMDMAGNVYEFVMDYKDPYYYEKYGPNAWTANPINEDGIDKGLRGGSWSTEDARIRVSYRSAGGGTDGRDNHIGFRCVSFP